VIPLQLPATTLAIGVGAFKLDMVEFPAALLRQRAIVVDHLAGAQHEAADLIQAGIGWSKVRDLSGMAGVRHAGVTPVLKTVGHAAWDLAAARVAVSSL
jgi:1-piperideine-2-carboxylate/1-pyrroline-2-carboxylate reductase [NAD(P)H]